MIDLSKWPSAEAEKYREVIREIRHDLETLKKSSGEGTKIPESIINMFEEFLEGREENVTPIFSDRSAPTVFSDLQCDR